MRMTDEFERNHLKIVNKSSFIKHANDGYIIMTESQLITSYKDEFFKAIEIVRRRGYALVDQYANMGLSGLALPLLDKKGNPVGAISTTFQNISYPGDSGLRKLLPHLQHTAEVMREII